ncbi:MAG: glycosyltransferase [bacterium]
MSIKNILVSVIIPTYNRAHLLERAIKSVLSQSYSDLELIVIDDGSTDNTQELLANFIRKDKRVKTFCIDNSGVSRARNTGIHSSNGSLIAFLDSDDEWLQHKLKKQVDLYKTDRFVLCHSNEIWIRNGIRVNQMKKHEKSGGDLFLKSLPLCCISPSASILEKEVFDEVGLFDESFDICEDYELWLRITAKHRVDFIEEPLIIKYGGHEHQLSRRSWGNDIYRVKALQKIIKNGLVSDNKLAQVVMMLKTKSQILSDGFNKHGDIEKAKYYRKLVENI